MRPLIVIPAKNEDTTVAGNTWIPEIWRCTCG